MRGKVKRLRKDVKYKTFGKDIEFKKYLHGVADARSRLLFRFWSGIHGESNSDGGR